MVRCESAPGPVQAAALVTTPPTQCTVKPSVSARATAGPSRINTAATLTAAGTFSFFSIAASRNKLPPVTREPLPRQSYVDRRIQTQLLDGDAPRSDRRGRQSRGVEDQRETSRRRRHREWHSRQGQRPITHVHCRGATEGNA